MIFFSNIIDSKLKKIMELKVLDSDLFRIDKYIYKINNLYNYSIYLFFKIFYFPNKLD